MSWLLPGALLWVPCSWSSPSGPGGQTVNAPPCCSSAGRCRHRPGHQPGPGHHPPLLHRRPGGSAGRPRRDRHHGVVAAPLHVGRPDRPRRRALGHVDLGLRPVGPHSGLVPLPPFRGPGGRDTRRRRHLGPPVVAPRAQTGGGPGGGPGPGLRPGGALVLHRRYGLGSPHGRHPDGHADAGRRRWFRGRRLRRRARSRGLPGFGRAGARPAPGAGFGGGFPGGAAPTGGFPGAGTGRGTRGVGFAQWAPRRIPGRLRRWRSEGGCRRRLRRWLPQLQQLESRPDQVAPGGRTTTRGSRRP